MKIQLYSDAIQDWQKFIAYFSGETDSLYLFLLFKNNFLKIKKKYYFNIFINKKTLQKSL